MSRLTDLIARAKAKDSALGDELEREFKALANIRLIPGYYPQNESKETIMDTTFYKSSGYGLVLLGCALSFASAIYLSASSK